MVVSDHHSYGLPDYTHGEQFTLASIVLAMEELSYNIGPDHVNKRWGHALNMQLGTEDWDLILKDRPHTQALSDDSSRRASDTDDYNTDDEERAQRTIFRSR